MYNNSYFVFSHQFTDQVHCHGRKKHSPELQVSSHFHHMLSHKCHKVSLCKIAGLQFVLMEQTHIAQLCELKKNSGLVLSF